MIKVLEDLRGSLHAEVIGSRPKRRVKGEKKKKKTYDPAPCERVPGSFEQNRRFADAGTKYTRTRRRFPNIVP